MHTYLTMSMMSLVMLSVVDAWEGMTQAYMPLSMAYFIFGTWNVKGNVVEFTFTNQHELLMPQLQLFIQDQSREELVSLPQEVSLRQWHDVRVSRERGNITLRLDGDLEHQQQLVQPIPLRTTSPLYIGGLPSESTVQQLSLFIQQL